MRRILGMMFFLCPLPAMRAMAADCTSYGRLGGVIIHHNTQERFQYYDGRYWVRVGQ